MAFHSVEELVAEIKADPQWAADNLIDFYCIVRESNRPPQQKLYELLSSLEIMGMSVSACGNASPRNGWAKPHERP